MSNKTKDEWQLLAQHEQWVVKYRSDSRIVRLNLAGTIMYLEREAYQLLWGVLTEGLDELERVEDSSARLAGLNIATQHKVSQPLTRH